jgi:hypothetical protein
VHPDDTSDAANAVPRVKSSTQRWRAITERREREQKAIEEREREQAAAVRKTAAEARVVLKALVGEQGIAWEPFTKEERSAWRWMKALGNGGSDHRHARNSEGNSRFPSREVPLHLDLVPVRVSDTTGCRKPRHTHKPKEQGSKWPIWLKIRPRAEKSEPTAPHAQNLGGSSRSPPREVKSAWGKRAKPFIDAHIDSRLPQLCDGISNLREPTPNWRGIWHVDVEENGNDLGVEQPEAAAGTDKSLFTRKTNPRDAWWMAEVKRCITVGKDLSHTERKQVDALLNEFVDVFGLSMSEVYAVPGAEHKLNIPAGTTFRAKVNQRPLSPPQRTFFNAVLDKMLEAGVIRLINPTDNGGGLSIEELQCHVDDQCITNSFESAFHTPFEGTPNSTELADPPAEKKWRICKSFKALNNVTKVAPVPQGDIQAKQQRLSGHR